MQSGGEGSSQFTEVQVGAVVDDRWHSLPGTDILRTNVLPKLDVPSLCRSRAVCKDWNMWICDPNFHETHKKETLYLLMSAEVNIATEDENWEIEDVITGRHFVISQSFLEKLPFVEVNCSTRWLRYFRTTFAADKGFVLMGWRATDRNVHAMCVINPVTKSYREIPPFPRAMITIDAVTAMVVDEDRLGFKIFVIYQDNDYFVFESQVGLWIAFDLPSIESLKPCHILMRGRDLYVVFVKDQDIPVPSSDYVIWILDTETCEFMFQFPLDRCPPFWIIAYDAPEHLYRWSSPQLVACGSRIFVTALDYDEEELAQRIGIWEIDPSQNYSSQQVAVSPDHVDGHHFWCAIEDPTELPWESSRRYIPKHARDWDLLNRDGSSSVNVLAFGTNDQIIFTSITGSSLVFSLSDQAWVHTPSCWKSFQDERLFLAKRTGLVGNVMPLTLSPVPEIAQPTAPWEQPT